VTTLLNSGNAVFSGSDRPAEAHAVAIARSLHGALGLTVHAVVRTSADFLAAVAGNPVELPDAEHPRFLGVFSQHPGRLHDLQPVVEPLVVPPERFAVGDHAAYLHCASGILESQAAVALLGNAGRNITTRNWATVLKLAALLQAGAPRPTRGPPSAAGRVAH
jgi:uncharacterized protein (DUF1697 family)